jgi:spore coat protein U-like protein
MALSMPARAAGCSVTASAVAFGNYPLFSPTPTDSSGTISVACSGTAGESVSYRVSLGAGVSGSVAARRMSSPTSPFALAYNLHTDAARTVVWGDGSGSSVMLNGTLTLPVSGSSSVSATVYGRMPARQNVFPGVYADSITVTVNF